MTVRSMMTACLVGLTTAVLAAPASAQINGTGGAPGAAAAGSGPSPATIGGGGPSAGMAGSATGGAGNPGFANPGISSGNAAPGATTPGLMTAPGASGAQPITGVPAPSLPAEVPGRVAPRDGGHPR